MLITGTCATRRAILTEASDNAGTLGITVASDKTLIGEGSSGVIKGKGLRIVSGANNIIIQFVITYLPPGIDRLIQ